MALSIAELVILSFIIVWSFKKIKVPPLIGMLLLGVIFGPYVLNRLAPGLLAASGDLRMVALIVILLRAGFELSRKTLKRVGGTALLLAFIPAIFEGVTITFLAPIFLPLSYLESAILGTIIAAVSPAVVVPLMLNFIEQKKGTRKGIPTMMLAASSIDDVFVIVVYSALIGIYTGQQINLTFEIVGIPISIILGIAIGIGIGIILYKIFDRFNPRATKRVIIILAISVLLTHLEHLIKDFLPFASLLVVMAIGFIILEKREKYAHEISAKLAKLWIFAEIILFTMVGAQVNIEVAFNSGLAGVIIILTGLVARSLGTYFCLFGTDFTFSE